MTAASRASRLRSTWVRSRPSPVRSRQPDMEYTPRSAAQSQGDGLDQSGLAHTGQIVQQDVPARQHRHDDQADAVGFSDDDLFGLCLNGIGESSDINRKHSLKQRYNMEQYTTKR